MSHRCPTCGQVVSDTRDLFDHSRPKGLLVQIPSELDTVEFRAAWANWIKDRADRRKSVTKLGAAQQMKRLLKLGPAKAVLSIENSIAGGWTGLFDPNETSKTNHKPSASEVRNSTIPGVAEADASIRANIERRRAAYDLAEKEKAAAKRVANQVA